MSAKELFYQYGGSHQMMERDGVDELYRSFHISSSQEKQWREEFIKKIMNQSSISRDDYRSACDMLKRSVYTDGIDQLILYGIKSRNMAYLASSWQLMDYSIRHRFFSEKEIKKLVNEALLYLNSWNSGSEDMILQNYIKKWKILENDRK